MLPKVFHHVLFEFVILTHLLSTFFFQTILQTLELFLFFALSLTFYDISDKFTVFLYLFICALHKSSHCTVFFFTLLSWLLVRRCHHFDCVPSTCQKVLLLSSTQFLCVKGSRAAARVVAKAEATDCCCCSNDCFQFIESVLCKNVSARVKCSQCCCDSKVNTTKGGDVQPVILKELQSKEEEWF